MLGLKNYFIQHSKDIHVVLEGYQEGMKQQMVSGLTNTAKSLWLSTLFVEQNTSMVVITHNLFQAQKLYDDLEELLGPEVVYLYPVNDLIASEIAIASPELRSQRIEVLNHLVNKDQAIYIVPVAGMKRLLAPPSLWKKSQITFEIGKEIELDCMVSNLISMGYERETMVAAPGEFSLRGGIIDIYPLTETYPVRIELFDVEVDSIRYFDKDSQRSLMDPLDKVVISPAKETLIYPENLENGAHGLEKALAETLKKVKDNAVKAELSENVGYEINQLKEHQVFQDLPKYTALLYKEKNTLLDYLSDKALMVIDELSRVQDMSKQLDNEEAEWLTALLQKGAMVHNAPLSLSFEELNQKRKQSILYLTLFLRHHGHIQPQNIINLTCRSMQNFHGQIHVLKQETDRWKKSQFATVILVSNHERARKMENVLADYEIDGRIVDKDTPPVPGTIHIVEGQLDAGFELPQQKLVVITEKEVFNSKAVKTPRRNKKMSNAERLKNYNELKVGDYVVHVDHGIGRYVGIETLEVNGVHKDYLHLRYKGTDQLYVPVEKIDQVQKYLGSEGKEPKLYSLGGSEWKKVKSKAKSSVQDIADDLIKLYAEREASVGHAFQPDDTEQKDFEAVFPYQETDDQLQAIEEIKKDMEQPKPMDRLLCGDVGYGKTEVALRAAFKAIAEGKQVAFLVPTTILAQQHYETAVERFEDFPINIGVLSRFRSRKEQQETLAELKKGTLDMIIGTHRLLSKDVVFKDLGLLIVDEEQRFGVTHKEKIKQMKANVDVLTLTATPIPRTLHMSMLGVRDLSVIETPPENRFPVQTYVTEYSGALVRESIERELARGGQVYFLYNRVEDIHRMTEHISALVPNARVAAAHGQMKETELETVMIDFLEGNYDVLVSTTIIETGVDIPNVNTLIVYNADKMGLSQLYQLRGRVGRSNRVAYAYFTYQKDKVMNEVAEKRLQAIKEFTELGSGFKIAMRDLSIRGAGNLLGAQQHGFIDSVGFDLYSQMLKEAIEERRGKKTVKKEPVLTMDIEADAYLPETYIEDSLQKINIYKKFKSAENLGEIQDLQDELIDRFGEYPQEVHDLFAVTKLGVLSKVLGVEEVKQEKNQLKLLFTEEGTQSIDRVQLFETVSQLGPGVGLGADGGRIKLSITTTSKHPSDQLHSYVQTLEKIYKDQTLEKKKTG